LPPGAVEVNEQPAHPANATTVNHETLRERNGWIGNTARASRLVDAVVNTTPVGLLAAPTVIVT
jgi:hypothetical protein